jgi:hypothetical protein
MAHHPKTERRLSRDLIDDNCRHDLMKECLRKAEEIRCGLKGRQHTDSTKLVSENRGDDELYVRPVRTADERK